MNDHEMSDAEIERLLSGETAGGELSHLAEALNSIRSTFGSEQLPPVGAELSEFVDVNLLVDKGDLLVTAGSNAIGPAMAQAAGLPKRRATFNERKMHMISKVSAFIGTITGKVVLGTVVVAAATGGAHTSGMVDVPLLPEIEDHDDVEELVVPEPEDDSDDDSDGDDVPVIVLTVDDDSQDEQPVVPVDPNAVCDDDSDDDDMDDDDMDDSDDDSDDDDMDDSDDDSDDDDMDDSDDDDCDDVEMDDDDDHKVAPGVSDDDDDDDDDDDHEERHDDDDDHESGRDDDGHDD